MTSAELAKQVLRQTGGVAKTAQFRGAGLENYTLCALCDRGVLERIRHGYYRLASAADLTEAQLLERLLPEAVVCLDSALFTYGYSDFAPRVWTLAVPRTFSRTRLKVDAVPVKPYFVREEIFSLGQTTAQIDGATLRIYDRERTICDCFRYRSRLDSELFQKAVHAYAADERKNLEKLSRYAREMKIYKRVMDLMEVLFNG